jgi:hypothetical protein
MRLDYNRCFYATTITGKSTIGVALKESSIYTRRIWCTDICALHCKSSGQQLNDNNMHIEFYQTIHEIDSREPQNELE